MYDNDLLVEYFDPETQEWEIWAHWATHAHCRQLAAMGHTMRCSDNTGLVFLEVHSAPKPT